MRLMVIYFAISLHFPISRCCQWIQLNHWISMRSMWLFGKRQKQHYSTKLKANKIHCMLTFIIIFNIFLSSQKNFITITKSLKAFPAIKRATKRMWYLVKRHEEDSSFYCLCANWSSQTQHFQHDSIQYAIYIIYDQCIQQTQQHIISI